MELHLYIYICSLLLLLTSQSLAYITVVGLSGGVAENVALKLSSANNKISLLLDAPPQSDLVKSQKQISVYINQEDKKDLAISVSSGVSDTRISSLVGSSRVVVAVGDDGRDFVFDTSRDQGDKIKRVEQLLLEVATAVKSSSPIVGGNVRSVVCATSVANDPLNDKKIGLFKKPSSPSMDIFRGWHKDNSNAGFGVLRYGKLTGGVPGKEPLPFLTMPLSEPELHPSYTLNSLIITPLTVSSETSANQYAESEVCTRSSLSEALCRLVEKSVSSSLEANGFIQSITGSLPSEKDWEGLFSRLLSSSSKQGDVQLLKVDMAAINKPTALGNWLVDTWFPQALIEADAATILTGARPVRATKISSDKDSEVKIKIVWEDLQKDLTVRPAGALQIEVTPQSNPPAVSVKRLSSGGALPGETMIVDKLLEAINKSVYKKQFCTPRE